MTAVLVSLALCILVGLVAVYYFQKQHIRKFERTIVDLRDELRLTKLRLDFSQLSLAENSQALAAAAVHDMSQPITAIRGGAYMANRRHKDGVLTLEGGVSSIQQVLANSDRAVEVMERYRLFAAPEQRSGTPVVILDAWRDAQRFLADALAPLRVTVSSNVEAGMSVYCGRVELSQVFANLMLNAFEAMDASSKRVICITATKDEEGQVRIAITDTGRGLSQDVVDRVGRKLFSTKPSGVGLGFTVARRIVESYGGSLSIANRGDEVGVIVVIALPSQKQQ